MSTPAEAVTVVRTGPSGCMSNRGLFTNAAANFFGRAVGSIVNVLAVPFYAKWLGAESYGLVGFAVSLQASLVILDFGLATTVNREVARLEGADPASMGNTVATLARVYHLTALTVFIVLVAATPWLTEKWLNLRELTPAIVKTCLLLAAATIALRWPVALYSGVMQGAQKQVAANCISGGVGIGRAVITLGALFWIGPRLEVFFGCQVVSAAVEFFLARYFAWQCLPAESLRVGRFDLSVLMRVWRFAVGFSITSAVGTFVANLDRLLVARLLPLDQLGVLAMLGTAAGVLTVLGTAVSAAAFPKFVKASQSTDSQTELGIELEAAIRLLMAIVVPGFLFFVFFTKTLLITWTGASVPSIDNVTTLRLLALGAAINALGGPFYMIVVAQGSVRWPLGANLTSLALLFPIYWLGLPAIGIRLAAAGWCLLNLILILTCAVRCRYIVILPRLRTAEIVYWLAIICLFGLLATLSSRLDLRPWLKISLAGGLSAVSMVGMPEARRAILSRVQRIL